MDAYARGMMSDIQQILQYLMGLKILSYTFDDGREARLSYYPAETTINTIDGDKEYIETYYTISWYVGNVYQGDEQFPTSEEFVDRLKELTDDLTVWT